MNLGSLVSTWLAAIKAAEKDRKAFDRTGEMCQNFFTGSVGFMWGSSFRSKYLGSIPEPKFEITIAKAYELVSIVGPTLMWNNPGRYVTGHEKMGLDPSVFAAMQGVDPNSPEGQQMAMAYMQEEAKEELLADTRHKLMQWYLNYSQREQPGGGLRFESQLSIIEALVKGRGCIRVDTYQPSGTDDTLTGAFHFPVDDLFIDPDCTRPNLSNAKWIAIRHVQPHWEVERRFGWPEGSLKGKASGVNKLGAAQSNIQQPDGTFVRRSETNNLVVWFEIFSKCGAGTRLKQSPAGEWHEAFEQSVGDFAYICVAEGVNELLNARGDFMETATTDQVSVALDWPIQYYRDGKWPVALLDFWHNPGSAWPLATLAMGLGELIFMNVFISSLADRIYQDGLSKAAIRSELTEDAVSKLMSWNHEVLELNPTVAGNINELVTYLQRPQVNFDAFRMLEYVSMMFDKRVGLMELMYGLNPGGKVSRTAADANIKGEAVSVRPEYMATQVEAWQTEIANLERIAAGDAVAGKTLAPGIGQMGSQLWTELISKADPDTYMREMRCRIEANSLRRPNKARDNQNLQQTSGYMLPMLQWYAGTTGNTDPLNEYLRTMGRAMEQEVDGWLMPPIQPQGPSPEELAAQQEMAEIEKANKVATTQKKDAEAKLAAHKLIEQGAGLPMDMLQEIEVDDDLMYQEPM